MKQDDQNLKNLLREIDVPGDLKHRLRLIPDQAVDDAPLNLVDRWGGSRVKLKRWWVAGLAAAISGALLYCWWPATEPATEPARQPIVQAESKMSDTSIANELAEFDARAERLRLALFELELVELNERLLHLQRRQEIERQSELSVAETHSLIFAAAEESGWRMGADSETTKQNLESIRKRYPDTQGALLAEKILQEAL